MVAKKASLKKTSLIAKANKNMFVWVAIVSVVLGITVVGSIILAQRIIHMDKVISYKSKTLDNINSNIKSVSTLTDNIRVLSTNQALISSKARPTDETLQVILDALPSEANSLALGASFQDVLLSTATGATVNSISVSPVAGVESSSSTSGSRKTSSYSLPSISFSFSVKGSIDQILKVLNNLEKSIRVLDTQVITIENQNTDLVMTVTGVAYYQPAVSISLTTKKIE